VRLRRVGAVPTYVFEQLDAWKAEATAEGADVIDLGIGSHDLPTPQPALDCLISAAAEPPDHGYPTSAGLPELRAAVARWYRQEHGVELDPDDQVAVTWGASEALAHLPWVLLQPGDTAVVPEPCYPIHRYSILFSGARAVGLQLLDDMPHDDPQARAAGGTAHTRGRAGEDDTDNTLFERLAAACERASPRPRVILVSFPHNPTTRCVGPGFFPLLVDYARDHYLRVIHDFAYAGISFDGFRPPSILAVPGADDVAVEVVSLSKSHNMAGWRVGFVAGNAEIVGGLRRLKSYLDYGVTLPVQRMALAALAECTAVPSRMAGVYQSRRNALCAGLAEAGWDVPRPCGTMFVWARLPATARAGGSLAFAERLLREAHVAVSPGIGFTGPSSLAGDDAGLRAARAGPEPGRRKATDGPVDGAVPTYACGGEPGAPGADESRGRGGVSADEFVRFALVQPEARLREACRRIGRVLQGRSG
jgi:alanine-synthesizing transaminase